MTTDIGYPRELPHLLATNHSRQSERFVEETRWEKGEDRDRQLYRSVPQIASVSALYNQSQYNRWCDFWEDELEAGTRSFDIRLAHIAGGLVHWWTVQAVSSPKEVTLEKSVRGTGNFYRVSFDVILLGGPSLTRIAPTMRGLMETDTKLLSRAPDWTGVFRGLSLNTNTLLGRLSFISTMRGLSTNIVELTGELDVENLLLETGDDLLLEDGGQLLLE